MWQLKGWPFCGFYWLAGQAVLIEQWSKWGKWFTRGHAGMQGALQHDGYRTPLLGEWSVALTKPASENKISNGHSRISLYIFSIRRYVFKGSQHLITDIMTGSFQKLMIFTNNKHYIIYHAPCLHIRNTRIKSLVFILKKTIPSLRIENEKKQNKYIFAGQISL